jgi:acyl CoA:acetate/3-ketoacid CoA transferase beta subunit
MASSPCTPSEKMVARACQELKDHDVVFVGIGLPNLACNLARATHAPDRERWVRYPRDFPSPSAILP